MAVKEVTRVEVRRRHSGERRAVTLRAAPERLARIPALENGDCLTRREYERRYEAMPQLKKAELIEGVVHMPSPVHMEKHAQPALDVITWLGYYRAATPGVLGAENATLRLDPENVVQPDALLRIDASLGGKSHVTGDDYLEGPPELVVEVAASSVSIDLHQKLKVYRRCEVQEYLVWQVDDERIDWFTLREGEYVSLEPDGSGILQSQVFPGLRLEVAALLNGDLARVLAVLKKGLTTKEHASFAQRLSSKSREATGT